MQRYHERNTYQCCDSHSDCHLIANDMTGDIFNGWPADGEPMPIRETEFRERPIRNALNDVIMAWPIRSWNPYNRIGKYALQDIYEWRDRGLIMATPVLGKIPDEDVIVVSKEFE